MTFRTHSTDNRFVLATLAKQQQPSKPTHSSCKSVGGTCVTNTAKLVSTQVTVSETPRHREGTTSDRHHQGLLPPVKAHTACLLSERLWWQETLANDREQNCDNDDKHKCKVRAAGGSSHGRLRGSGRPHGQFLLRNAFKKLDEEENWEERRMATAQVKAMTELVRRVPREGRRGGSVDFLVVRGSDDAGKGSALALRSLVRCVPFFCRPA